jgi:transposase InsO family protein
MREMDLRSVRNDSKREYKKRLSLVKKQNILQKQFNTTAPNLVWISDVTCFKIKEQWFYICVVLDLFSRRVVEHRVGKNNSTYLITSTFKTAFEVRNRPQNLTFHSDRGVQYTSKTFQKLLTVNKIVQSFSNSGRPNDNAVAEAFFSSLKKEELYRTNYKSEKEFRKSVADYMLFYNSERPHRTLAYKTHDRYELEYDKKKKPA